MILQVNFLVKMKNINLSSLKKINSKIGNIRPVSTILEKIASFIIPHNIALAEWIPPCASGYDCAFRSGCGSTGCTFCRDGQYHQGKYIRYSYGYLQAGGTCNVIGYCNQCWTDLDYCTAPTGVSC